MSAETKHDIYEPEGVALSGNSETGDVHLFYRMPNGDTIALVLSPALLRQTMSHLATGILESPHPAVKALAQLFAIRDISAHLHQAATVTLRYEIEAGATLETSLDRDDAVRLNQELTTVLASQEQVGSQAKH